ncbi:MAG: CvpA family protein [Blastocatellia bacterium]|nr:CvpA family protein [Blastocatellia bacterium]MCS7158043.1 CvpA family protein [Blastocatellia bacterium]MCX7752550.1 CvpA family protein [Blastocatellia bacterium]MDW8167334.1 CvpA family protein [Acidobacteriota bacterium]MDW8257340.1 CvpA family protein [Acidobacteriota bacterium]
MTVVDAIVLFAIGLSTLRGLSRGFARSVVTTAAAIVGFFLASSSYRGIVPLVRPLVESETMAHLLAFLSMYLVMLLIGFMLARALHSSLRRAHLSWLDHGMGGLFGLLRGWILCSVVYLALSVFPWRLDLLQEGFTSPYLARGAALISRLAAQHFPRFQPVLPELKE